MPLSFDHDVSRAAEAPYAEVALDEATTRVSAGPPPKRWPREPLTQLTDATSSTGLEVTDLGASPESISWSTSDVDPWRPTPPALSKHATLSTQIAAERLAILARKAGLAPIANELDARFLLLTERARALTPRVDVGAKQAVVKAETALADLEKTMGEIEGLLKD